MADRGVRNPGTSHRLVSGVRSAAAASGVTDAVMAAGGRWAFSGLNALDALAIIHGTDKSSRMHGYATWYARYFGPGRFRQMTILEIGVGGHTSAELGGNSLRMWRDYFPRSQIIGVDLYPKSFRWLGRRIQIERCDQSNASSLRGIADRFGPFDIVIDDGSHIGSHVALSFQELFPHLKPGGWYVIEDLHSSFLDSHHRPGDATPLDSVHAAVVATQLQDTVVASGLATAPDGAIEGVSSTFVHPGVAFIQKSSMPPSVRTRF